MTGNFSTERETAVRGADGPRARRIEPPYPPMEALSVERIPEGKEWRYEPKWDGFRCLAFRRGSELVLQSKSGQPLQRYFPELTEALLRLAPNQFVLDAEIVIPVGERLSFDELLLRLHPAKSRVDKLAKAHPAWLIVFDLLENEHGDVLASEPFGARRELLEGFAARYFADPVRLSPSTTNVETAKTWLAEGGGSLDGIIAKRADLDYRSGERTGMQKYKNIRTADCVVGGFRYGSKTRVVGSLLLGLYDEAGLLHHVGFTSGVKANERAALTRQLEGLVQPPGFTGRAPGGPSRWSTERSGDWQPLAPRLVVEVAYDHFAQGRFRHGTRFIRWRPDKAPRQCTMGQIEEGANRALRLLK